MEFQTPTLNLTIILPVIIVIGWGVALMVVDLFLPEEKKKWLSWLSLIGLGLALIQSVALWGKSYETFIPVGGTAMIVVDNYATFLNVLYLLTGILTILLSVNYLDKTRLSHGEFYLLVLFSISGMMLMGMSNDLIMVFLALELLSIPLYILSGYDRKRNDSEESALKYFLLGAFSSGFFMFGIVLMYGATGSTALPVIAQNIGEGGALSMGAMALLLVGFGFKVAAVPFHMWTPDVYQGAPTAVTAFMSVGAKIGGFAAMIRLFMGVLPQMGDTWVPVVAVLAALTMIVGNVVALAQQNIKRMLAYSSIAHAGYIMMAVASNSDQGVSAALFYMMAYLFTNLGAFAIVIAIERSGNQGLNLDDYKGLAKRNPALALVLAYFMLSLTGVPPTGGFSGKFFVFRAVLDANPDLLWLTIVGVVTSVVSGYFYLRIVYYAFMFDGEGQAQMHPALNVAVTLSLAATVALGFLPAYWFDLTQAAAFQAMLIAAGG
ncbi:MAG: NADH-quinone oxidoreductase subunit N [Chloroflexi bacterium]|nr:NADH-quinone oxidoreductase subunit N [Chloroflexota bacterium]